MAKRVVYRLAARSPFHIGERGVGLEEASVMLHSDTLFSALCLTLRELGEDLDAFLGRLPRMYMSEGKPSQVLPGEKPPPLRLSSAFPYAGDVYFFPRPMLRLRGFDEIGDPKLGKKLKKVQFVSRPIFEGMLAGQPVAGYLVEDDPERSGQKRPCEGTLLQGGRVWATPEEVEQLRAFEDRRAGRIRFWAEDTAPRVTVDRATNRSQVYAVGRVHFAPECGLFFLVEYEDLALQPRLEKALRALSDAGVGGERSSGHGQFDLGIDEAFSLAEPTPGQTNAFATLSLYWPAESEVKSEVLKEASYRLTNRRGWLGSPDGMNLRRRGVRMLTEGSVLRQPPQGALADVKPLDPDPIPNVPHDVWRYGLAFPLRCRVLDREEAGDER